ncbi:hypothetical protein EVAR_51093_1 [Eumeta japonica]|uniref:Uncharacterized protein n=1 Tax=Eumeta variegata TaxID=151549 RepID=A0A4C1XLT3_EUMVA|nr:hypothetical protein EVAR_51093_1 [Eumeta japonica]
MNGFIKANSSGLPKVDSLMLGEFLASNKDFCSAEFKNAKTRIAACMQSSKVMLFILEEFYRRRNRLLLHCSLACKDTIHRQYSPRPKFQVYAIHRQKVSPLVETLTAVFFSGV